MSGDDSGNQPYGTGPIPQMHTREWVLRNASKLTINWEALPQLPFWGPLMGYDSPWYRANVAARVIAGAHMMKRELTQPEIDAISYHMAQSLRTRAMEVPIFIGSVYALERRTRATYKFPFWQPKLDTFDPNAFPSKSRPFLTGQVARAAWHVTRASAYGFFAHLFVSVFLQSYATSVWMANMQRDTRLEVFNETVRSSAERAVRAAGIPTRSPLPQRDSDGTSDSQYSSANQSDTYESPASSQATADRSWGSAQASYQQDSKPFTQASQPEASRLFEDDDSTFDDASPIAGSHRQKPSSAASSGSAWDRIRHQSGGGVRDSGERNAQTSSWASRQQDPRQESSAPRSRNDYTFDQADEDRALAKQQAQKEFDAMLDKERYGDSDDRRRR